MAERVKVAQTSELPPGKGMAVEVEGQTIALFNVDGAYHAIADTCTHAGGPLSDGRLDGNVVTCPWHGAVFDVTTGEALGPPADDNVHHYQVQVEGDDIHVVVA